MFTLQQALDSIQGRREFIIKRYDDLVVLNYVIQLPDTFDGIRREFRGITFDEATGEIVSLPFHKFFNLGQTEATQWHRVKEQSGVIYEKLDGSLIHVFRHRGSLRTSTRMSSYTPQAREAYNLLCRDGNLYDLVEEEINRGFTPCFEYVAPSNRIVVAYPKPRLVYLHSRNRSSGVYHFNHAFDDKAKRYAFRFPDIQSHTALQDAEGYVCQLADGTWLKIKCDWYLQRHGVVDALMRPAYHLYAAALEDALDDMSQLAPHLLPRFLSIDVEAKNDLLSLVEAVSETGMRIKKELVLAGVSPVDDREFRKRYALQCQKEDAKNFSLLMMAFGDDDEGSILRAGAKKRLKETYRETKREPIYAEICAENSGEMVDS